LNAMMTFSEVQTIRDSSGNVTVVVVPIDLWREMESEETAYLLRSENMKRRLLEAIERAGEGAVSLEEARARLACLTQIYLNGNPHKSEE